MTTLSPIDAALCTPGGPAEPTHLPVPEQAATRSHRGPLAAQLGRFAVVGVGSTVLNLGLFALLTRPLGSLTANFVALLLATVANTGANRAWTFGVRGRDGRVRHQLQGLAVFGVTWAATSAALLALHAAAPGAPVIVETVVVAGANVLSTLVRFVALRRWMTP